MITTDIDQHAPLTISQIARKTPGNPTPCTVTRWCHKGLRGIKLRYRRCGNRLLVTPADMETFQARLRELDEQEECHRRGGSPRDPRKPQIPNQHGRVNDEAEKLGI